MVTRDDLADLVYEKSSDLASKAAARRVMAVAFEALGTLLERDGVVLRGFGRFTRKSKPEREGRNPLTGDKLLIAAKTVVQFRPSPSLKARVDN